MSHFDRRPLPVTPAADVAGAGGGGPADPGRDGGAELVPLGLPAVCSLAASAAAAWAACAAIADMGTPPAGVGVGPRDGMPPSGPLDTNEISVRALASRSRSFCSIRFFCRSAV